MQQHAFFVQKLCNELAPLLQGALIKDIFSLNKKEIFFHFKSPAAGWINLKIAFEANSFFLSFPDEIHRQSRFRISQFSSLAGTHISHLACHPLERSFHLITGEGKVLLFKLHGRNANILVPGKEGNDCFRKQIRADADLDVNDFILSHTNVPFASVPESAPWINEPVAYWLKKENLEGASAEIFMVRLNELLSKGFYLCREKESCTLTFWDNGEALHYYTDAFEACNDFAALYLKMFYFKARKEEALIGLRQTLKLNESRLRETTRQLDELEKNEKYRHYADILMANLHVKQEATRDIRLFDFYSGKETLIRIDPEKSLQANAERYYRKAKNRELEKEHLRLRKQSLEKTLADIKDRITAVAQSESLRELKENTPVKVKADKEKKVFREFGFMGYQILVGKSAKDNDALTFKIGRKEDTWLHVRDAGGSHVIIRRKEGQNLPNPVLEYAAGLAAFFSKRRNESLCPVIYTPRKFVRKQKGMADGQVKVEKEEVLMIKPQAPLDSTGGQQ